MVSIGALGRVVAVSLALVSSACAKGDGVEEDATDVTGDPVPDFDAVPDPDADPALEPSPDPEEDTGPDADADPTEDAVPDPLDDPDEDPADDPAPETGADASTDVTTDSSAGVIYCVPEPPPDCSIWSYGCCSSDRRIIYCVGGTSISSGCGSRTCGPDPSAPPYMNCI
jgi:hypothetical protein